MSMRWSDACAGSQRVISTEDALSGTSDSSLVTANTLNAMLVQMITALFIETVDCAFIQRMFSNATVDPVTGKINMNCPVDGSDFNPFTGVLSLNVQSLTTDFAKGILTLVDTAGESYEFNYPSMTIRR